jgi:lauroyl/myristoyl acyltransferase
MAYDEQAQAASVDLIQHRRDANQRKILRTSSTVTFFGTDLRRPTAILCLKRSDGMRAIDAHREKKGEDDEFHVKYLQSIGGEQK